MSEVIPASTAVTDGARQVVIVDTDRDFAATLVELVADHGYGAVAAHDAEAAVAAARLGQPAVALLDPRLGREGAPDLLTRLRAAAPGIVCVVVSARPGADAAVQALTLGADDYLRQPIDRLELLTCLARACETAELRRAGAAAEEALRRQNAALQAHNERLRAAVAAAGRLSTAGPWDEFGPRILTEMAAILGSTGGSLYLVESGRLVLLHALDSPHAPPELPLPLPDGGVFQTCLTTGEPLLIDDLAEQPELRESGWAGYRNRSLLALPLLDEQRQPLGVLALHDKLSPPFTPQDRDLAQLLCSVCAQMLQTQRAVEDLRASAERYRNFFESLQDIYFETTVRGTILELSPSVERVSRHRRAELLGRSVRRVLADPRDGGYIVQQLLAQGQLRDHEVTLLDRHGQALVCSLTARLLRDETGQPSRICGTLREIQARKEAERALRASQAKYRALTENSPDIIARHDREGRFLYVSPAIGLICDLPPAEFVGRRPGELALPAEFQRLATEDVGRVFATGQPLEVHCEVDRGGRKVVLDCLLTPERGPAGEIESVMSASRDVTEQAELEAQLRQAQKMEAVGQLAGGVAHDFNNLLQAIVGYTEITLAELPAEAAGRANLGEVLKAAGRATTLVRQLLAFSRRDRVQLEPVDLNQVICDLTRMLERVLGEHIELERRLSRDLKPVKADRGQLEQVLLNLCVNARDAMPEGGTITLTTAVRPAVGQRREEVILTVSDTGAGIPPEIQDRVFEPFFTTKEVGQGTGLGLATVYAVVERYGGTLSFTSQPGEGTTFRVALPAETPTAATAAAPEADGPGDGAGQLILIAEDDNLVRNMAAKVLRRGGYRVIACADGEEAVAIFQRHAEEIDLALLDVVMPRRGGAGAWREMNRLKPGLRVLFTTGYSFDALDPAILDAPGVELLQKPYDHRTMLRRIKQLLETA